MPKRSVVFAEERKTKILELLARNKKLLVPELCEYFKVSPATIRNDLRELGESGLLKRTHGGALLNEKARYEPDSYQKQISYASQKRDIARMAYSLIDDGDTIALDTGTTTMELARLLADRKGITVVTNDLQIASMLESNDGISVILTGGTLKRKFHCLIGPMAVSALRGLNVDKAFMGTNGITLAQGCTTPDLEQAEIKKSMVAIASEVVVLADNSKFGRKSFAGFLALDDIGTVISDTGLPESEKIPYLECGIKFLSAGKT